MTLQPPRPANLLADRLVGAALALLLGANMLIASPVAHADEPQSAEPFDVTFSYNPQAKPEAIYATLRHRAETACEAPGVHSVREHQQNQACAARLLDAAVSRIGRADVAALHGTPMMVAKGNVTAGN